MGMASCPPWPVDNLTGFSTLFPLKRKGRYQSSLFLLLTSLTLLLFQSWQKSKATGVRSYRFFKSPCSDPFSEAVLTLRSHDLSYMCFIQTSIHTTVLNWSTHHWPLNLCSSKSIFHIPFHNITIHVPYLIHLTVYFSYSELDAEST